MMDAKITDLIYRINGLVPKDVCKFFINFYEKHYQLAQLEISYIKLTESDKEWLKKNGEKR